MARLAKKLAGYTPLARRGDLGISGSAFDVVVRLRGSRVWGVGLQAWGLRGGDLFSGPIFRVHVLLASLMDQCTWAFFA